MPPPRRRAPRTPLRRYAYVVLGVAGLLVAGALVSGSAVLVGVAAVLAVVLAIAAAACLVEDSLEGRRVAAAANAALAGDYAGLFARRSTEHQVELERLVGEVTKLVGRVAELTSVNAGLVARNTDLEQAAALVSARRTADEAAGGNGDATVVTLPVPQFDSAPVQHARASGE